MADYTIFDNGNTRHGDARALLAEIREQAAAGNAEIRHMTVEQYASALIEDAAYFVDDDLLRAMELQQFDTMFDKALNYLAQTPSSGVRILTVRAA